MNKSLNINYKSRCNSLNKQLSKENTLKFILPTLDNYLQKALIHTFFHKLKLLEHSEFINEFNKNNSLIRRSSYLRVVYSLKKNKF